ncbi:hypothetical protein XNW1_580014 [Xenorhabdus nematophila str. Websteri]|nr:hypothetical protein XNW1_4330014 [Xenorhabdus nematophila str. Websteri]CEF33880.1 hypothetical protein XNW1_580014 [Xenorhabdus nematophila str. Websteri]
MLFYFFLILVIKDVILLFFSLRSEAPPGRFYHNKFTKRHIDSYDYYLKYHYTPFSELVDTNILLSSGKGEQYLVNGMSGLGKTQGASIL